MKRMDPLANKCLICNKDIFSSRSHILASNLLCKGCYKKLPFIYHHFKINDVKCLAIYDYNDFIRNILLNIKANNDLALSKALLMPIRNYLICQYKNYVLLPVPSSTKSNEQRGFNHVKEIYKVLGLPIVSSFYKTSEYKQSNSSKYQRINIKNNLQLDRSKINLKYKYLIVALLVKPPSIAFSFNFLVILLSKDDMSVFINSIIIMV